MTAVPVDAGVDLARSKTTAPRSRLSTGLSGVAGEYFVAAELSRRGYTASITLRNTHGVDILVSNADATVSVAIQVKTHQRTEASWLVNEKIEKDVSEDLPENLFFVFVCLNDGATPSFYVVPRKDVARECKESYRVWLETPGRDGRAHNDSSMRKFEDPEGRYRDRWDTLGLGDALVAWDTDLGG
jgi:hypothetical protein